jgi:hypothetical protein
MSESNTANLVLGLARDHDPDGRKLVADDLEGHGTRIFLVGYGDEVRGLSGPPCPIGGDIPVGPDDAAFSVASRLSDHRRHSMTCPSPAPMRQAMS